ncbi:hypothetical protein GCM10023083_70490 [Streptomyces phyllanthi]
MHVVHAVRVVRVLLWCGRAVRMRVPGHGRVVLLVAQWATTRAMDPRRGCIETPLGGCSGPVLPPEA